MGCLILIAAAVLGIYAMFGIWGAVVALVILGAMALAGDD